MLAFYAWLRRHPMLVDGLLALVVAMAGSAMGVRDITRYGPGAGLVWIGLVVPMVFRRRYPVGAFAIVIAAGALEVFLLPRPVVTDLAVLIMLYTLAAYRPRRISVPGLMVCLLGSTIAVIAWMRAPLVQVNAPQQSMWTAGATAALFYGPALLAWLLGDSMRWRRGYYRALEERAARLEAERDAQAQVAAAGERARIARELHDVVAHNVSVMVVQADGASYAMDYSPQRTREALAAISATGRQALAEMRHLLGVLRNVDEDGATLTPQPGLEEIADLLASSRAAGLPVSFAVQGLPRPLSAGMGLAAYRVVQESLTNARKHGGPTVTADVTLRFCADALMITVSDDGRGEAAASDGAGHGLIGMRERVEVYGGKVEAGPRVSGGYQVTATLPFGLREVA